MKVNHYKTNKIVCGCDESGRGSLAGPVVAAAVILPKNFFDPILNDSKKVSTKNRIALAKKIQAKSICWSVGIIKIPEIDNINILNASIKAMHVAISKITNSGMRPELLLIDGNKFIQFDKIQYKCVIKGDEKYSSIAAASIIAKTYRDKLMIELDKEYPLYNWKQNKGYPTKEHKLNILKYGININHRKSFKLLS